jgi:GNAT superfamily N-acetyltransferase
MSNEQLRLLTKSDLADAYELSTAAGWNQTREDWRMLLEISPRGCFGVEAGGRLVATTTIVCYQQQIAWIGMVLTKAEYRGRGFARRLLTSALDYASSMEMKTVKLDATEQGKPLYEKLGFQAEEPVERWSRPGTSHEFPDMKAEELGETLLALDRQAFLADRSSLLKALTVRSFTAVASAGFLLARPGRTTNYLGPCVALDPGTVRQMIGEALNESSNASWSWDLLPENKQAVAMARDFGFTPQRHLTRMARGNTQRGDAHMIYAIAGFELG